MKSLFGYPRRSIVLRRFSESVMRTRVCTEFCLRLESNLLRVVSWPPYLGVVDPMDRFCYEMHILKPFVHCFLEFLEGCHHNSTVEYITPANTLFFSLGGILTFGQYCHSLFSHINQVIGESKCPSVLREILFAT